MQDKPEVSSSFYTNEEKARMFDRAIAQAIEGMTDQKIGKPQQVMVGCLTSNSDVLVMTGADPEKAIFMALVALKQVYDTQIDNSQLSLKAFADSMHKSLMSLEGSIKATVEHEISSRPN